MSDAGLANQASWTLLDAAVTENWDHVREVVARLFAGGGIDDRWIQRRLDATRKRLIAVDPSPSFSDRLAEAERWRALFADLLDDHPEAADDLRALVEDLRPTGEPLPLPGGGYDHHDDAFGYEIDFADNDYGGTGAVGGSTSAWGGSTGAAGGGYYDPVSRAIQAAVTPGVLAFNPPAEMTQGRKERVEVAIARHVDLLDALVSDLEGPGQVQVEQLRRTSPVMGVELRGESFEIVALSAAPEQVVEPTAKWQFDIRPLRTGLQTLTLSVSLQLGQLVPEVPAGARIAVPVFERQIRIRVNLSYGTRRFLGSNWQWLVGTGIGAGGTAAAFLTVFH